MDRDRGFTMVELMTVLAVVAVVSMMAIPSFTDMLQRRRVEGVANELSADLQYARSEAVSRRRDVSVTTADDGLSYSVTTNTGLTDVLLKAIALPGGLSLDASKTVTYTPLRGSPSADADVSITVQSSKTAGQLKLVVNTMGRVQLCSPSGSLVGYDAC